DVGPDFAREIDGTVHFSAMAGSNTNAGGDVDLVKYYLFVSDRLGKDEAARSIRLVIMNPMRSEQPAAIRAGAEACRRLAGELGPVKAREIATDIERLIRQRLFRDRDRVSLGGLRKAYADVADLLDKDQVDETRRLTEQVLAGLPDEPEAPAANEAGTDLRPLAEAFRAVAR